MKASLILLITAMLCAHTSLDAQARRDSVCVHFRQSRVNLDTLYMGNDEALGHARRMIGLYDNPDSNMKLVDVKVIGAASPEGSVRINERLSRRRAERIFDYFKGRVEMPDSLTTFDYVGRDWRGLRRMVENDLEVPYRDDVMATLDEIVARSEAGETEDQHNLERLKRLHGFEPYLYMYYKLFPTLRASRLVLTFENQRQFVPVTVPVVTELVERIGLPSPSPIFLPQPAPKKPFYMALKTNMLYDVLAVPQVSAEFYLGRNMSIVGNWMYGWWDKDRKHDYWRLYGGDVALRWWFGHAAHVKPLTGHHLGIYGGAFTYDFEFGGRGYMGGLPGRPLWARCHYQAGVEYGYSLPIARRLNIDFAIGLGYIGGQYREYIPVDRCYVWQATKHTHWYGPTKIEISLSWLIGRGNYNKGKGGRL